MRQEGGVNVEDSYRSRMEIPQSRGISCSLIGGRCPEGGTMTVVVAVVLAAVAVA
jgi:hypothetical protein